MSILPWRRFDIETAWTPDVVEVELRKRIGGWLDRTDTWFRGFWLGKHAAHFQIRRSLFQQSAVPMAVVRIEPAHRGGTRMRITLRPTLPTLAVLSAFLLVPLALLLSRPGDRQTAPFAFFGVVCPIIVMVVFSNQVGELEAKIRLTFREAPALPPPPVDTGVPFR